MRKIIKAAALGGAALVLFAGCSIEPEPESTALTQSEMNTIVEVGFSDLSDEDLADVCRMAEIAPSLAWEAFLNGNGDASVRPVLLKQGWTEEGFHVAVDKTCSS
jgi:hypothetical protein